MMADNEGKNIAMAPSVPGGGVAATVEQHVACLQEATAPEHDMLTAVAFAIMPAAHVTSLQVAFIVQHAVLPMSAPRDILSLDLSWNLPAAHVTPTIAPSAVPSPHRNDSKHVASTQVVIPPEHIVSLAACFNLLPAGTVASLHAAFLPTDATVGAEMTTVGFATVTPIAFDSVTTAAAKADWLAAPDIAVALTTLVVRIS